MNQKGGSRTETLIKLVLIFVISLLSFSVGTFVGKQFSDSQHKMASLAEEFQGSDKRQVASVSATEKNDNILTDDDIASLTNEFINAEKDMEGAVELPEALKGEKTSGKSSPEMEMAKKKNPTKKDVKEAISLVGKAADRVAQDMSPSKKEAVKKRKPSSLPSMVASDTVGKYTVQVASYSTQNEAEAHAKRLVESGFNAFFLQAQVKGKTWYRVSVGLFGSHRSANEYKTQFLKQAKLKSAIVQKIVK